MIIPAPPMSINPLRSAPVSFVVLSSHPFISILIPPISKDHFSQRFEVPHSCWKVMKRFLMDLWQHWKVQVVHFKSFQLKKKRAITLIQDILF